MRIEFLKLLINLSINEPKLEVVFFNDDEQEDEELRWIRITIFYLSFQL